MSPVVDGNPDLYLPSPPLLSINRGTLLSLAFVLAHLMSLFGVPDFYTSLMLGVLLGASLQLGSIYLQSARFKRPVEDRDLLSIVSSASQRTGVSIRFEVWMRESPNYIVASTVNPFFSALVLSDKAISDILRSPEMGEIVIAGELVKMSSAATHRHLNFVLLALAFTAVYMWVAMFYDFMYFVAQVGTVLLLGTLSFILVLMLALFVLVTRSKPSHNDPEKIIIELYGMPLLMAKIGVFGGHNIPQQLVDKALLELPAFEEQIREERRAITRRSLRIGIATGLTATVIIAIPLSRGFLYQTTIPVLVAALALFGITFTFVGFMLASFTLMLRSMTQSRGEPEDQVEPNSLVDTELTHAVEEALVHVPQFEDVIVRLDRNSDTELKTLVVFARRPLIPKNALLSVSNTVVDALKIPSLVAAFIYSTVRLNTYMERLTRDSLKIILPLSAIFFAALFGPLLLGYLQLTSGLLWGLLGSIFVFLFVTSVLAYLIQQRRERQVDLDTCKLFPDWPEGLRRLRDARFVTPIGYPDFAKRLRRLQSVLGRPSEPQTISENTD